MIEVRKALAKDAKVIARIGIRVWEDFVSSWGVDVDHLREHVHAVYHDGTNCPLDTMLVAQIGDTIVGWIAREERDFRVSFLNIDPDHENKGIATLLLAGLEDVIKGDGFSHAQVELHIRSTKAISFFKENGYRVMAREMKYSTTLLDSAEKLIMRKDFETVRETPCPATPLETR